MFVAGMISVIFLIIYFPGFNEGEKSAYFFKLLIDPDRFMTFIIKKKRLKSSGFIPYTNVIKTSVHLELLNKMCTIISNPTMH